MTFKFDDIAKSYGQFRFPCNVLIADIIQHAKFTKGNILETGCGTGNYLCAIDQEVPSELYGVDISKPMLQIANGKQSSVIWDHQDCEQPLKYPNDFFEMSFSIDFIHYIKDLGIFFSEQFRILQDGGIIYVATHSEKDIQQQTLNKYFPILSPIEVSRLHKIENIKTELEKARFGNISTYSLTEDFLLTKQDYDLYYNKTLSALSILDDGTFSKGIKKMKHDIDLNTGIGNHSYTIIKAQK